MERPDTPYYNQYASYRINRPIGGNVLLETSLNLIFKLPFIEDQSQFRTAVFIDVGNEIFNRIALLIRLNVCT
jgi:Outer membrane protein/protective antigen OMA87